LEFSAQQVGVWGQDPQIASNGRTMINEAWANLNLGDPSKSQNWLWVSLNINPKIIVSKW